MSRPPARRDNGSPHRPAGNGRADGADVDDLRARLREAEDTLHAIRSGDVDSLLIGPPGHEQVYALTTVDRTYRLIVEAMSEGAATVSDRGVILEANPRLSEMTGRAAADLVGGKVAGLVPPDSQEALARLLGVGTGARASGELDLAGPAGARAPALVSVSGFDLDGMLAHCLVVTDLTEQRAAQRQAATAGAALAEERTFLENAQESIGLGWWRAEPRRTGGLELSPAAFRIFGLDPADFDGTTDGLLRLTHPDDLARVTGAGRQALGSGTNWQIEYRIIRPDGTERWIHQSMVTARDRTGQPGKLLGICQDITERKQNEEALRAAVAYNRRLIEASLDPLVTIGPDGTITDVNTATQQATGYGREELTGTEFSAYFADPDRAREGYRQVFREGTVRDYPLDLRHRDGHVTPVLYNASVYRDTAGTVAGVFAAARDVTQIRQAQAALRDSEARLRAVFEHAPVGMDDITPDGRFARVNPRLCQMTGFRAEELRSMRLRDLVHPDDLAADLAGTGRLLAGETDAFTIERRLVRKDGGVVWTEASRAVVRGPDGAPLLMVGVVRDLTQQRAAEAEIAELTAGLEARVEQRTAELAEANQNLEAFTYSVSHDLRAPLRALSGYTEALVEDYGDRLDDEGREYARRITAASERMAALIDDLLQLSRVLRAEMTVEPVDLSALAADLIGELRARDPGRRVAVTIGAGIGADADRNLIRAVLQNLLENAWKFTSRRADAAIEFGAGTADDGSACFFVRDNGAGFDQAYAGKLFQPFERLHTEAEFPGTGIGLASVRRIIRRHGGRVWAEGATGHGATFYFTLGGPGSS